MENLRKISLYFLVAMASLYAGFALFFLMCPFEQHFDTLAYIKYWQVVDGYMGKRMPVFGTVWLALFVLNLVVFFRTRRESPVFWIVAVCFAMHILETVFTIREQIPINEFIQSLRLEQVSNEQLTHLQHLREQTAANFGVRHFFQWGGYLLMSITPFLLPKGERRYF